MDATPRLSISPKVHQRHRSPRVFDAALELGYTALQAGIIAGRLKDDQADDLNRYVRPQMADLDSPDLLPDIDKAVERIVRAITSGEDIILCTDHDADGSTSHVVMRGALIDIFGVDPARVHSYISHRMKEGYGISEGVVDRILADGFCSGLLVSADQGSSDGRRIERLKAAGIDTVVTDHHGVEGKGPPAAYAVVNPVREDSQFPDKLIAGCHVAWLVMAAVRRELIRCGHLPKETPHLINYLPAVALGTTADCVSFARSRNNRLLVQRGLHIINTRPDTAWQAMRELISPDEPVTSASLAFRAGPMTNAAGRVDDAMVGVKFFRSQSLESARKQLQLLHEANEQRKQIERAMRERALLVAAQQVATGANGIAVWMEDGHAGIHGIVASRLVEAFGRPTICLSPKQGEEGIATGSARAIPGFNVREAFACIDAAFDGGLLAWGGHEGAGGLKVRVEDIPRLQELWDEAVEGSGAALGPTVLTDGPLPAPPDFNMLTELAVLEPYGREFDTPCFSQEVKILAVKRVGEEGRHAKLDLEVMGRKVPGIWFGVPELDWPLERGQVASCVFELSSNTFRGRTTLQLMVRHMAEM